MGKTALVSVYNKTGVVDFVKGLIKFGGYSTILSTGGTAKILKDNGIHVTMISDYTGHPEMLGGRVKTLQPKIHAGILAKDDSVSQSVMEKFGYPFIDMVVVNLYPFEQTIRFDDCTVAEAIEQIDIGGPTMLRAAAKNFDRMIVVSDPSQYDTVLTLLRENIGVDLFNRKRLALSVFEKTCQYDKAISDYLRNLTVEDLFKKNETAE